MSGKRLSKFLPVMMCVSLAACDTQLGQSISNFDFDIRDRFGGLDTSDAAASATADRPSPDSRGVLSYENYQVAIAERGDTVSSIASRVGLPAEELASFNGLSPSDRLAKGEVLALPRSVAAPASGEDVDITAIASSAIDRAPQSGIESGTASRRIDGPEPVRHQVEPGETAFSIARLYNVSVKSLAEWNGLGRDLTVREGQFLLVPVKLASTPEVAATSETTPGEGTATPEPPSASKPLPAPEPAAKPATQETASSGSAMIRPLAGEVIRPYKKRTNEGIDIAAAAGTSVKAAAAGTVAAITRDTDQVPILVLRHPGNLLTVYANIGDIAVKKGDSVTQGQTIAKVRAGSPSFLHFEVREGFESVDPEKYLN